MKLRARILPKYFKQIKANTKVVDYRQMESITFVNTKTEAEIELEIQGIKQCPDWDKNNVLEAFPDIKFSKNSKIYKIVLGKVVNTPL